MNWTDDLKPEDLPGDLQLVAQECGVGLAIKLAEKMGSIGIYIRPIDSLITKKKEEYILANFDGTNHKELAIAVGCSERWVYKLTSNNKKIDSQIDMFVKKTAE